MKNILRCTAEIVFAFIIIIVSYYKINTMNVNAWEKEINSYKNNSIALEIDNRIYTLDYLDSDNNSIKLYINNYHNQKVNGRLKMELNRIDKSLLDNMYIKVDDEIFYVPDVFDNKTNSIVIKTLELDNYEKRELNVSLLVSNDTNLNDIEPFGYSFIVETL